MRRSLVQYAVWTFFSLAISSAIVIYFIHIEHKAQLNSQLLDETRLLAAAQLKPLQQWLDDQSQFMRSVLRSPRWYSLFSDQDTLARLRAKNQWLSTYPQTSDIHFIPAGTPLPAGLPKAFQVFLAQKSPPTFVTVSKGKLTEHYYQIQPVWDPVSNNKLGVALIQWPTKNLSPLFAQIGHKRRWAIVQIEQKAPNVVVAHSISTEKMTRTLADIPIANSTWHLRLESKTQAVANSNLMAALMAYIGLLMASAVAIFFYHARILAGVGRDFRTFKQILRDLKSGELEHQYVAYLSEFRAAVGKFQKISMEIAEDSGFVSPAGRDQLTKLPNRDTLERALEQLLASLADYQQGFAVLMLEVDDFQSILEQHGYIARDAVVAKMAMDIRRALRKTDFVARADDHLFCAVFVNADGNIAKRLEYRLRQYISRQVNLPSGKSCPIGWSGGITIGMLGDSIDDVFERSRQAIARAREEGGANTTRSNLPTVVNM